MKKYLTPEGLEKIKKELEYLKNVKRREIAKRLKRCASFGDLTENAEYLEAREAQSFLEGRIQELEEIIANSVVVEDKKNIGLVQIGSIVWVQNQNHPYEKEKFKIVGTGEESPLENKISVESPLGRALLNKTKGEIVEVKTPKGKVLRYKIVKID
ncbi:MAG: transcription elongation factor GreA [Thermoprotei archaeon]|nr:MAG: transcription elongation factor GreA [Thermoprotei archaeon]